MIVTGTRWRETLRECLGTLHRELLVTLAPVPRPDVWAFIVGCYNSGTTLLDRLLGQHPQIATLPTEGQFLTDEFVAGWEIGVPRMWVLREDLYRLTEADRGPDPIRIQKEWSIRFGSEGRRRPVLLEKSPPNAARTRWLQGHFPNAHFIGIVRNGYAVAEGIRRKAAPKHLKDGWPLAQCALQWARSHEVLLGDEPYLDRLLWVRYEKLTAAPEQELSRIFRFLGVDDDPARLDLGRRWAVHERQDRVRNMNAESIARLSKGDVATINRVAGRMLEHFGYSLLPA